MDSALQTLATALTPHSAAESGELQPASGPGLL